MSVQYVCGNSKNIFISYIALYRITCHALRCYSLELLKCNYSCHCFNNTLIVHYTKCK